MAFDIPFREKLDKSLRYIINHIDVVVNQKSLPKERKKIRKFVFFVPKNVFAYIFVKMLAVPLYGH